MKFPFFNDPKTGQPDEMVTLTTVVTLAAVFRFLVDGMTFHVFNQVLVFSKLDAMVYVSLIGPVIGAHGYVKTKKEENEK